jgi:hypothetical protein
MPGNRRIDTKVASLIKPMALELSTPAWYFSQSRRSTIFKIRSVEDKAIAGTHTLPPTAISILRSDPVNFGL